MPQRKQYIIDKKFQLKTTFSIIGSIFLIVAIITALLIFNILNVNNEINSLNQSFHQTNEEIANIIEIQDNIVQVLSVPNPSAKEPIQKMSQKMAQHHDINMKLLRKRISTNLATSDILKKRLNTNYLLLIITIIIVVLQGVIFFIYMIRQTHRIAGPIYVMSMYMNQIIIGNIPKKLRKLRKKDYFKDFYALFEEMIKKLQDNKN